MRDGAAGWGAWRLVVIAAALLTSVHLVRSAAVAFPFSERPVWAAGVWASHPRILLDRAMAAIGLAAARGRPVPETAVAAIDRVARKAPLIAEPYLVKGAIAQLQGRDADAERLFVAARDRDPRAPAARYFLADRFLRTGRVQQGLTEMAVLVRLIPQSATTFAPALAAYARSPEGARQVDAFFRGSPELKPLVLEILASDAANAGLVLQLAGPAPAEPPDEAPQWQQLLIRNLVLAEQFDRAYETWRRLSGVQTSGAIFNPGFRDLPAPPPFNWRLSSGGAALAEPLSGDRLQIIYYGREAGVFAGQLLLLDPGRYRLSMEAAGEAGDGALRWRVRCYPGAQELLDLPIAEGRTSGTFVVPQRCKSQELELLGVPGDFPETVELTIGKLALVRAGAA